MYRSENRERIEPAALAEAHQKATAPCISSISSAALHSRMVTIVRSSGKKTDASKAKTTTQLKREDEAKKADDEDESSGNRVDSKRKMSAAKLLASPFKRSYSARRPNKASGDKASAMTRSTSSPSVSGESGSQLKKMDKRERTAKHDKKGASDEDRIKKKKNFRTVRKQFAKATGAHHVVGRTKRWLLGTTKVGEVGEATFSEEGDDTDDEMALLSIANASDEQLLSSKAARRIVACSVPRRLRTHRLRRVYAAHNQGYDLGSMSNACAEFANQPCVIVIAVSETDIVGCFLGAAPFGTVARVTTESKAASLEASVFRYLVHEHEVADCYDCDLETLFDQPGAFVIAARTKAFLAIAANSATGGAALRLSSDLSTGSSEPSPLFDSPHLHTAPTVANVRDTFQVCDVEVYVFELWGSVE